ncbi:MAG: PAS domain S-box protein [Burkholderiales bacterium]|nr:PAS domain S-box protein [Burkholderiales bacterium]
MRINLPVVQTEYPFPHGETLVSTTDLKGRILYGNPAFIALSGYTREELLGQPHNLIRHPDMPEEAFRDMWATIAAGRPWSAPVKNRRKDGRFYWVMANVTPLVEDGRPVGYMSVRSEPTREQVAAADALYATMRQEKAAGRRVHTLDGARLRRRTVRGRLARMLSPGLGMRISLACAVLSGTAAGAAAALTGGTTTLTAVATAAGAALGGVLGGFAIGRMVVVPLQRLIGIANRMAAGDLTQTIEARGEGTLADLARALAQLNVNLRSIVRDARTEVERMKVATREIAAGNQDLSARTESQAASLQETASSMEEITSAVRNGAQAAAQAAELAGRAREVTSRGSRAMNDVAQTMQVIDGSSRRIGEIIGVIDGIAFQTNILALNAAVEAARAGEQGRGFAVVASEVRALAQRTSGAAREVKQIIGESAEQVEAGNRLTAEARRTMDNALSAVHDASEVIEGISGGAQEQLAGISQINEAVTQLDSITQRNAALVEQIAASALELQAQAAAVAEAVQVFRLEAGAGGAAAARDAALALRRAMRGSRSGTAPAAQGEAAVS